ncbi:MAG: hypothetical protein SVU32_04620, partial [Candidatus Nanohaloarchaea archaeon]|nr:hypothetical protein [Candidatus Nanohaloarchaea archaeon]
APGVHRNDYLETADEPDLYSEKDLFMSSLDAEGEKLEQAFDRLYRHVVEEGHYREEELEQEITSLDLQDEEAVQEEVAFFARNWIDRSHLRWAEENDIYAFVRETDEGKEITTKQSVGRANMYDDILDEIQDTATVDKVIVDDVRNVELDADILITNNVFDYIDPGEIGDTVDRLTAEEGAYMETSLLNHGYRERGATIDRDVSPDMELIEAAPDVNFWWSGYGPAHKEDCPANEGIRLYRPA